MIYVILNDGYFVTMLEREEPITGNEIKQAYGLVSAIQNEAYENRVNVLNEEFGDDWRHQLGENRALDERNEALSAAVQSEGEILTSLLEAKQIQHDTIDVVGYLLE